MIILKVTKSQGFPFSLKNTFMEKPQCVWRGRGRVGGWGVGRSNWLPFPAVLGLSQNVKLNK